MKLTPYFPINIIPLTTFTANHWSALLQAPPNSNARFFYRITNVSGTSPSLTIRIFYSCLSGSNIHVLSTDSISANITGSLQVPNTPINYKVYLAISGTTPSFTVEMDVQFQEL